MRFDKELEKELEKLTETHLEALRKAIIERLAEQGLDNSGIAGASLEIEDNELKSWESLSQEELDRQQEIEALKAKFKQH